MADAVEDLVERRGQRVVRKPIEEVVLQRFAVERRSASKRGVHMVRNVLDLDAGHAYRLAPKWHHNIHIGADRTMGVDRNGRSEGNESLRPRSERLGCRRHAGEGLTPSGWVVGAQVGNLRFGTMATRVEYDEFGMFHENAAEYGLPFESPPTVERIPTELGDGRRLSTLRWGSGTPRIVLFHGGAQNAHTWDTVALALDRPLIAPDLPGHGHSDSPAPGVGTSAEANADDMIEVIDHLAADAELIVGMSLGGLTAIVLASKRPDLVKRLVLVDITPGVTGDKARAIHDFVRGPATFASFDDLLARTMEFNPTRSESSLRRGILHNALQLDDGTWVWRHRRDDSSVMVDGDDVRPDVALLWDDLEASAAPLTLVRGIREQSVVDDADVAELMRRRPGATVIEVDAGHSVQGDAPLELAGIIGGALDASGNTVPGSSA